MKTYMQLNRRFWEECVIAGIRAGNRPGAAAEIADQAVDELEKRQRTDEGEKIMQAIVNLRAHLKETQQEFAVRMHLAVVTVARWETRRPPRAFSLIRLLNLAKEVGCTASAEVFQKAI